ncbi:MAG: hypothetical protein K9K76_01990 [Halanaerobiales bacterium]|nr:hypothetical protein [Halanaerobiales bacterium]
MDIEFHYDITYLIALKAEFSKSEAKIIATSSQLVDDNTEKNYIENDEGDIYKTYISQTANILKPSDELFRIYPSFHFVPGNPMAPTAKRKDGTFHLLNTTPGNKNVRSLMDYALKSNNLYSLGIAAHAYSDSWSHQNFVGYYTNFNSLKGVLEKSVPNIGHADASHKPDQISLVWEDKRLISENTKIDNNKRFLKAAHGLLNYFSEYNKISMKNRNIFLKQIERIFSIEGNSYFSKRKRKKEYNKLSIDLSGDIIPKYKKYKWFNDSVRNETNNSVFLPNLNFNNIKYIWRNQNYQDSPYFKFCEAIKSHQKETKNLFKSDVYKDLSLNRW